MQVSLDQAIEIHAKTLKARHGKGAIKSTADRAAQCQAIGDFEGAEVWLRVKAELKRQIDEANSEPQIGTQNRL